MKLSEKTIAVLQGFSAINSGLWLMPGKHQETVDQLEDGMAAFADLEEDFPCEFGIINLGVFLANLSNFSEPSIEFDDGHIYITDGEYEMLWHGVSHTLIKRPQDKKIKFNSRLDFELPQSALEKARKFASVNKHPHITFLGNKNGLFVEVTDKKAKKYDPKNPITHRVTDYRGDDFEMIFNARYFNGLVGAKYNVSLNLDNIARFVTTDETVSYYMSVESMKER
jgi:hypothetical protein